MNAYPHAMTSTQTRACWAALVAFVEDVHAPQDQLSRDGWAAAESLVETYAGPASIEEKVLFDALAVMVEDAPIARYDEASWAVARELLVRFTAAVESRAGS